MGLVSTKCSACSKDLLATQISGQTTTSEIEGEDINKGESNSSDIKSEHLKASHSLSQQLLLQNAKGELHGALVQSPGVEMAVSEYSEVELDEHQSGKKESDMLSDFSQLEFHEDQPCGDQTQILSKNASKTSVPSDKNIVGQTDINIVANAKWGQNWYEEVLHDIITEYKAITWDQVEGKLDKVVLDYVMAWHFSQLHLNHKWE